VYKINISVKHRLQTINQGKENLFSFIFLSAVVDLLVIFQSHPCAELAQSTQITQHCRWMDEIKNDLGHVTITDVTTI
jgi:hypothetical protein